MSRNFIGGKWRDAQSREARCASVDPSTGRAYGAIADSGAEDVDLAVQGGAAGVRRRPRGGGRRRSSAAGCCRGLAA